MRYRAAAVVSLLLLSAGRAFGQGPVPVGNEIHVNTYTTFLQRAPSIAADAAGRFVVVWESHAQDAPFPGAGVFGQRFDAAGAPLGTEFQVNVYTTGYQIESDVASDPSGAFVVVWTSAGIMARRYDATGAAGPEFQVAPSGRHPGVAVDGAGRFVVVWEASDGTTPGVFGRRYDSAGVPEGPEFRINSYTTGFEDDPAVAMDAAGGFVVVWNSTRPYYGLQIDGQRFDAGGAAAGAEFRVTPPLGADADPDPPSVAMDASGNFVVVWRTYAALYGYDTGIHAQRYDVTGAATGSFFRVNSYTTHSHRRPAVASDAAGAFLVLWQGEHQDGYDYGIFGQGYDASGVPVGGQFQVNSYWTGMQYSPTVAAGGAGHFVTAWTSTDAQEGIGHGGIFAQRVAPDLIFRDGLETGTLVAWSGGNTDAGDLAVSGAAAMGATAQGLVGVVDDTVGLYVEDGSPDDERRYRARFYIDPNGFDPGEGLNHLRTRTLLVFSEAPARRVAAVVLRRVGGVYTVMGRARQDDDSQADTGFFPVSDGPHAIEIDLVRATGPEAFDGTFELWIDGVSMIQLTSLDNELAEVDFVRMGALSVKTGANGTLYWDEFESRRGSYIGLLP